MIDPSPHAIPASPSAPLERRPEQSRDGLRQVQRLGRFGTATLTVALLAAFSFPPQAQAAEPCGQTPSAFERVDPGDDESGIGGTGAAPKPPTLPHTREPFAARGDEDSGIGGTGRAPRTGGDESGIGGTGIFGTVLRVDRLCVNGFEIQVPETLQIESAMGGDGPQALTVGQIVFIRALRTDSGLIAQHIQIQPNLNGVPWEKGPRLELLSIEGFVFAGPNGPRLGRLQLDFGSSESRPPIRDLMPGTRVRATGFPEQDNILRIAPLPRTSRPDSFDRTPNRPDAANGRTEDTRGNQTEQPEPKFQKPNDAGVKRSERAAPPDRPKPSTPPPRPAPPERPERPEPPDWIRPERPALDDRPQPRVIERPDIVDRALRR